MARRQHLAGVGKIKVIPYRQQGEIPYNPPAVAWEVRLSMRLDVLA
jgi:hypothetical protein